MTAPMTGKTWTLTRDGCTVDVHELTPDAPADAPVVLLAHAAPGSGRFDPDPAVTAATGVRLISWDRPGYGDSDPVTDGFATVDRMAADAAAVLDRVLPAGATAGVVGWSGGGRVVLALAALWPELVGRAVAIATPAPDDEVPWYGENRQYTDALRGLPASEARAAMTDMFTPMIESMSRDERFALVMDPSIDEALLADPELAGRLRGMVDEALRSGVGGLVADICGYTLAPWGFEPSAVSADVLLGYGAADVPVGPAHGEWWAAQLPHARLEVVPDVGHLVVVPFWERALAHLTGA